MKKELIRDSAQIIAGNFLVALGVNAFILPNDVLTGGLAGVAVALQPLVAIEPTLFINAATSFDGSSLCNRYRNRTLLF